ncbi:hypothetical protein SRABI76_03605 [Microbacterium oxydans]|uniref:hypothetical protein n=1 Tax=Microbacterium oxydans TaxID=82380 RepID=UPI001D42CD16|nr:hypothetical protein [Microbacterium oxydans]CAH0265620.1 hypothetical protein SRABI76_03605 [Microbacterium oxydans]
MSATEPDIVTIRLVDYDTKRWIWVPHIWPHEGFTGPGSWADAVSRTVAKRSWLTFMKRPAFRADLVQMSLSRDGESTNWTMAYAANLSQVPRIVRIDAHDRVNGAYDSLEQFLHLDQEGLNEPPVVEPFFSTRLGHGITALMRRRVEGALHGVRLYGWELGNTWVSLSLADFDLRYLDRLRVHTDALARALAFDLDSGAGPQPARARD